MPRQKRAAAHVNAIRIGDPFVNGVDEAEQRSQDAARKRQDMIAARLVQHVSLLCGKQT
jgi:hypothetical protein